MAESTWLVKYLDEVHVICEQADASTLMLAELGTRAAFAQLCLSLDLERFFSDVSYIDG